MKYIFQLPESLGMLKEMACACGIAMGVRDYPWTMSPDEIETMLRAEVVMDYMAGRDLTNNFALYAPTFLTWCMRGIQYAQRYLDRHPGEVGKIKLEMADMPQDDVLPGCEGMARAIVERCGG